MLKCIKGVSGKYLQKMFIFAYLILLDFMKLMFVCFLLIKSQSPNPSWLSDVPYEGLLNANIFYYSSYCPQLFWFLELSSWECDHIHRL